MKAIATLDSVRKAKEELERKGEKVTDAAIRHLLGGGSYSTINRHLRTLRGMQMVSADVAKHLLAELRRQRVTVEKMQEDREPVVFEEEHDNCNITEDTSHSTEFDGTSNSDPCSEGGATNDIAPPFLAPPRGAYVLKAVTHSPWHATAVSGVEGAP